MSGLFASTKIDFLSINWNTKSVKSMKYMFSNMHFLI
mgnify:CR=1 FL=1